jgi:signal recognition particle receptor subunit beta
MATPPPVTWKVVYWGPKGAGKTTCLRVLERRAPRARGAFASIAAQPDHGGCRFELLPLELSHQGRPAARVDVFSVPGCAACVATRGLVLQKVDAVVFVADADPARLPANRQAAFELVAALHAQGRDPADVPIVMQVNKRELPQALPTAALVEALRPLGRGRQVLESVASLGEGVTPTLRHLARVLLTRTAAADAAAGALPPAPAPKPKSKSARTSAAPASAARSAPAPARGRDRGRSGRAPALAR